MQTRLQAQTDDCQESSQLEFSLIELVKMRVSQINGRAYCVDRHSKDARAAGKPSRASTLSHGRKRSRWSPKFMSVSGKAVE
jgi:AhpD family alkylhydroperoxidase